MIGKILRISCLTAGLSLVAGCGFLTDSATTLLVPPAEEVKLGTELSNEVEKELILHPSSTVQQKFQAMGDKLVAQLGPDVPEEYEFIFKVVQDDTMINAFAAPGGRIYFYTGLLYAADNEAAVMGVLAHEISHVTERHGAKQMVAQFGLDAVLSLAIGNDPGIWTELLVGLGKTGALLNYSREDESESDRVGLGLVVKAGYDPNAFADFFALLGAGEGQEDFLSFLSTHPAPGERAEEVRSLIAGLSSVPDFKGDPAEWNQFIADLNQTGGSTNPAPDQTKD